MMAASSLLGKVLTCWKARQASALRAAVVLLLVSSSAAFAADHQPAILPDGDYRMIIDQAVLRLDTTGAIAAKDSAESLAVFIQRRNGAWGPVVGLTPEFNRAQHWGLIDDSQVTPESVQLSLAIHINGDTWVPGGAAHYDLHFADPQQLSHEDGLQGTARGVFDGVAIEQDLPVTLWYFSPPPKAKNAALPNLGEHPRLLFRAQDVPALMQRRAHPVVDAAFQHLAATDSLLSLSALYQLTGEAAYAQRAQPLLAQTIAERGNNDHDSGQQWAKRLRDVAYAYDLLFDQFDEARHREVVGYLSWIGERLLERPYTATRDMNWWLNGYDNAVMRGAAGLAALAIAGDPGEAPQLPRDRSVQPHVILPLAETEVAEPIAALAKQKWESGQLLKQWMAAGPFPDRGAQGGDFLAHHGGSLDFHRSVDAKSRIRKGRQKATFAPLPEDAFWDHQGRANIEFTGFYARNKKSKEMGYHSTAYFYTAFQVSSEQVLQFFTRNAGSRLQVWLNGIEIADEDFVRLQPGTYFLLIRAHAYATNDWGKTWMSPTLQAVDLAEMAHELRRRADIYALQKSLWRDETEYFLRTGGANPQWRQLARKAQVHLQQYLRYALGEGGWSVDGARATAAMYMPLEYHAAHVKNTGQALTAASDVESYVLRHLMQTSFGDAEGPHEGHHQTALRHQSIDDEDMLNQGHVARAWPSIPRQWQPAALWYWHQLMGLTAQGEGVPTFDSADSALFTFLHYPVAMTAQNPHKVLGKTWQAPDKGAIIWRNGFAGAERDVIVQVFARREASGGESGAAAGSLAITAFGHHWAVYHPASGKGRQSHAGQSSTVVVDAPDLYQLGPGTIKGLEHFRDGGGSIQLSLDALFQRRQRREGRDQGAFLPTVDPLWRPVAGRLQDQGISGGRSVLVDYSGKSGVPALLLIVDQIRGGKGIAKTWRWSLPRSVSAQGDNPALTVDDQGFQIQQGQGLLRARLFAPSPLAATVVAGEQRSDPGYMAVRGEQGDEGYFVAVVTLQNTPAPPPTIKATQRQGRWQIEVGDQRFTVDGLSISRP